MRQATTGREHCVCRKPLLCAYDRFHAHIVAEVPILWRFLPRKSRVKQTSRGDVVENNLMADGWCENFNRVRQLRSPRFTRTDCTRYISSHDFRISSLVYYSGLITPSPTEHALSQHQTSSLATTPQREATLTQIPPSNHPIIYHIRTSTQTNTYT